MSINRRLSALENNPQAIAQGYINKLIAQTKTMDTVHNQVMDSWHDELSELCKKERPDLLTAWYEGIAIKALLDYLNNILKAVRNGDIDPLRDNAEYRAYLVHWQALMSTIETMHSTLSADIWQMVIAGYRTWLDTLGESS